MEVFEHYIVRSPRSQQNALTEKFSTLVDKLRSSNRAIDESTVSIQPSKTSNISDPGVTRVDMRTTPHWVQTVSRCLLSAAAKIKQQGPLTKKRWGQAVVWIFIGMVLQILISRAALA